MTLFRIALAATFSLMLWGDAQAVLTIKITRGIEGALPIAIVPFSWETERAAPTDMAEVISNDLRRTGRFAPMPESDLPGRPHDGAQVDFRDWRRLGIENLVVGRLAQQQDGAYQVQFQLIIYFTLVFVNCFRIVLFFVREYFFEQSNRRVFFRPYYDFIKNIRLCI